MKIVWAQHVTCGERRLNLYRIWLENLTVDTLGHLYVDGKFLKCSVEEIGWEVMDFSRITQDREQQPSLLKRNKS
jgi:hypothetical protein